MSTGPKHEDPDHPNYVAYCEGYNSEVLGRKRQECPYDDGSPDSIAWYYGWDDSRQVRHELED